MILPKNKRGPRRLAGLAVLGLFMLAVLAGCGARTAEQPKLYDAPTNVYAHPQIGAVLTVPENWLILSEDEESVVFMEPEGTLTLTMIWELGGYTYYSDDGLLDMAEAVAGQVLQEPEILQRVSRSLPGNNQLVTALGVLRTTPAGENSEAEVYDKAETNIEDSNAVCEVMIFSPLPALRYYLVTVAEPAAYEQNAALLSDIYASFYLNETEDVLYEGLHQDADTGTGTESGAETELDNDTDADAEPDTQTE